MGPIYTANPDSTIKRADELIALGQDNAALRALNEAILSKRYRSSPLNVIEPMMLKYIELCVNLRQGRMVKEGLHQYRNIAQNISVISIETIVSKLLEMSEQKVAEARAKADQIAVDVDDLEASETPESVMLSTVSGEQSKDRTDRAVVTPWLKFLWEVYRTVLDILRNNSRLEVLYHQVTNMAFTFCLTYDRKTEFRRLCEILRTHFQNVAKYAHQPHAIKLNESVTLQQYFEVRFNQLNVAAELELWQEAFKSVEDIYTLFATSKTAPKPVMMSNYYEKLTKIFMVGEDYLFHSAAWNKYSSIVRVINKDMSDEEQSRMASIVLISALAIPIITTTKTRPGYVEADDHRIQKLNRLSMLMGLTQFPTRTSLLKEALNKNILSRVRPEIRDLYNILEVQFHPLSICKKINPIMVKLSEDPDLAKYVRPLHQVILTRLLQQLSQVYTTVKLDFVLQLASFPAPYNYDAATIEKFIMNGCKRGELNIRIDHVSQSLTFETDLFAPPKGTITEGSQLQSSPSDLMRSQLSRLGVSLHAVVQMIDPSVRETAEQEKSQVAKDTLQAIVEEHKAALERKKLIEQRKEIVETEHARREKEASQKRAQIAQEKAEAERKRLEEEQRRREEERQSRIRAEIQRDQAMRIAAEIKSKTGLEIKSEEVEANDVETLMKIKVERLQSEQRDVNERLKQIAKRLDHTERAYRMNEIPLLEKDFEHQQKADKIAFEKARKLELQTSRDKHQERVSLKNRFSRMLGDYKTFRAKLEEKAQTSLADKQKAAEEAIEAEKQERIAQWRAEHAKILEQREAEQLRIQREEEELAKREQEEEERIERLAKLKQERDEERERLAEQARLQQEREEEVMRKREARQNQPPSAAAPASSPFGSRREPSGFQRPAPSPRVHGTAEPPQSTAGSGSRPAYVPPGRRDRPADSSSGDRPGGRFGGDRPGGSFGDRSGGRFGGDRPGGSFGDRSGGRFGGDRPGGSFGDRSGSSFGDRQGGRFGDRSGERPSERSGERSGERPSERPSERSGERPSDRSNLENNWRRK